MVPTPVGGLTEDEADRRRADGLGNDHQADPGKSVWQILCGNLFTLFNGLNAALAVCLALVGSWRNMLFMGVVVSNTVIGTVQELRSHNTIRRLKLMNAPVCHVLRGGAERECRPEELVKDDLIVLRTGDQVPADAVITVGSGAANESLLTGEADPVPKQPGDWLMSGSYITEGRFTAQLVLVGAESYINRLAGAAKRIKPPRSELMTDLNKLIRVVSMVLVPLGLALFAKAVFLNGASLQSAVPSAVAAMIGMIPEGLMLLTSVALAVGVVKLGARNTLVQELHGIETLARADVLCLDKTGTLTTGEMAVQRFIPIDVDEPALRTALSRYLGSFEETPGAIAALRRCVAPGLETPLRVLPFSSARKKSAASFTDGTTIVLGAPSFVLGDAYTGELRRMAEEAAMQGLRVLVLCECDGVLQGEKLPAVSRTLGLCVLEDALRPHCADTLDYFRAQGVTVKIISGDDPRTVAAVARRAGVHGADQWVDASTLRTEDELRAAAERCTVFGRTTPQQKQQLVYALQAAGHSVAMTGDGVNDIPALKAADCSIAMAGGSDAAKHAAQLTLLDADFSCMPLVVDEGRRVINNITRAASLFLVKTMYSFALAVLLLVLPGMYPFQPIQLTLVSTLTIGVPTFILALQPNRERIRGDFLRNVLLGAVPAACAVTVCACVCMMMEHAGWPQALCSTLATLSAGIVGLMSLIRVCLPFDPLRALLVAVMGVGLFIGATTLRELFLLETLGGVQLLMLGGLTVLGAGVLLLTAWVMKKRFVRREKTVQG